MLIRTFFSRHRRLVAIVVILIGVAIVLEVLFWLCLPRADKAVRSYPTCISLVMKYVPYERRENYKWSWGPDFLPESEYETVESVLESGNVFYIDRETLKLNGIACYPYVFVANDMPQKATRYVTLHEAFHVMGEDSETMANYKAAKLEPVGMIETVLVSVFSNFRIVDLPCRLGISWGLFKIYFLGWR